VKSGDSYEDIIDMEHHRSDKHPHMSMLNRAAQFSPFAALTGFEDEISESGRLTSARITLDENKKSELDERLNAYVQRIDTHPFISIRHFVEDEFKEGGRYVTTKGNLKKIDFISHAILMMDGTVINTEDVYEIE